MSNSPVCIPLIYRTITLAISLTLWSVSSVAFGQTQQSNEVRELQPNQTLEREMTALETHRYKFDLKADEFFQVRVEQKGVEVALLILDTSGNVLAAMSRPNDKRGPEVLSLVAEKSSSFVLEVRGLDAKTEKGNYTIKREASRTATAKDKRRVEVEQLFMAGMLAQVEEGQSQTGINQLSEAQAGWRELADNDMAELTAQLIEKFKQSKAAAASYEAHLLMREGTKESLRAALAKFQEANRLYRENGDENEAAKTLNDIGRVYSYLGEKQEALEHYNQSLSISRVVDNKIGQATTLNNIGSVYADLGEYQKALDYYNQSLPLRRTVGDTIGEAAALNNIGSVYADLRENQKALDYYYRALRLFKTYGARGEEATVLNGIGAVYAGMNENQKALDYYNQSQTLFRTIGDKRGEAYTLTGICIVYSRLGKNEKALNYCNQALPLFRVAGDKRAEAMTLGQTMVVWESFNNRRMAVFYGKQAINKYQELRQAIQGLDKETQKTFIGTIGNAYKRLADILIADGRLLEAEQVLAMLKQEEVFDYLRRDASEADKLQLRADLTKEETEALKRYNEIADKITALGAEFSNMQELQRKGIKLTPEQVKRHDELASHLNDASRVFDVFLRQLAEEFAKRTNMEKDWQENRALQADLKSWGEGEGVVFLYTLVGEDRYRVILITPKTQIDGKTEIKMAKLNEKIEAFRQAVQNPRLDSHPLGKELYDILIRPIEKQLDGAKAKTLLWSLDGNLRLLPLAALWDGNQYFGQKYRNVTVTLASRTRLGDVVAPNWRALALGVSEAKRVKDPDGTREISFAALPAVKTELLSIVQSAQSPNGVLPGQRLMDAEFNEPALEAQLLRSYKIIHIASHFSLNPGDSRKSFLLLGDGNILTVDAMRNRTQLDFTGVELLTLSACQTAVLGKDSSGKEIEGFGYVAQQKGAKAILASLWSVADESTQLLMSEFYRLLKENPKLTKAAALQFAQREMIEGKLQPSTAGKKRDTGELAGSETNAPTYAYDPKRPYAHPYYWSPFILIGNWR